MTEVSRVAAAFRPPGRRGITLLECMIAMGVLAIGVMSVAALLPVGRSQMTDAEVFDHCSAVGRAAFRDLHVHGYLRPDMWLYTSQPLAPVTHGPMMLPPSWLSPTGQITSPTVFQQTPPAVPLVLDPLLVALNSPPRTGVNTTGANAATQAAVSTFPAALRTAGWPGGWPEKVAAVIPRITLRDAPNTNFSPTSMRSMPLGVADRLFHSTDDAKFSLPSSELSLAGGWGQNLNPVQECIVRSMSTTGAPTNISRASQGDYSFFVTVTPDFAETWGAPGWTSGNGNNVTYNMYQGNATTNRLYTAAIVVCYKRDLRLLSSYDPTQTFDRGERMVWADFLGRGEVRLRVAGISSQSQAEQALAVKPNQWIMVLGRFNNYSPLPPLGPAFTSTQRWIQTTIKWYKIVSALTSVEQDGSSNSTWYRSARVAGSDWTPNGVSTSQSSSSSDQGGFQDEDPYSYADLINAASPNPPTGIGVIIGGAIAVFEKTINLDDNTAYSF